MAKKIIFIASAMVVGVWLGMMLEEHKAEQTYALERERLELTDLVQDALHEIARR